MANWVSTTEITDDNGDFSHERNDLERSFEVEYDAFDHNPQTASIAPNVPTAYSPHPNNLNAL
jgi:hypothetical protein